MNVDFVRSVHAILQVSVCIGYNLCQKRTQHFDRSLYEKRNQLS